MSVYAEGLPGERQEFALHPLDRPGVPVWTASAWGPDGSGTHGVGYGATDGEALRSAHGELAESVAVASALGRLERVRGSWAEHVRVHGEPSVLDPRASPLPAGSPWTPDTPLEWIAAEEHPSGATVLVPVELVASTPAEAALAAPLFTPVTNGLGAGESRERALSHGLLELLQRDGNAVKYRALDRGLEVELDSVGLPEVRALLDGLQASGFRVLPKLASDEWGMTNLYVVGWDRDEAATHPLMATSCGEAVHPDRDVALRKALHEWLSSRARKAFSFGPREMVARVAPPDYVERAWSRRVVRGEDRAYRAMQDWLELSYGQLRGLLRDTFHSVRETRSLSSLPTTTVPEDPAALLADVSGRLRDAGLRVLVVPLTEPGAPWTAVKAIVPGLEVETATYHRLGARGLRKLLDAGLGLVGVGGARPRGARPVLLPPAAGIEDAWLDVEAMDARVGRLYPLYREPDRHAVTG